MPRARTAQLSVRIHDRDKQILATAAAESGMDPSVAVRQMVEMVARRLEAGGDLMDALYEIKTALRNSVART